MEEDDDIKHMAASHKNYLASMIAEQEAALHRFQTSSYLSESTSNTMAASARAGGAAAAARGRMAAPAAPVNQSLNLSVGASPYAFARGGRGGVAPAPTPGYTRPLVNGGGAGYPRSLSPTPSNSSERSSASANQSLLADARRTLSGAGLTSPSRANLNDTAASTATITTELEAKMWSKDKAAWERRMAELEERLRRVNGANQQQLAASSASSPSTAVVPSLALNVPVVNGRGVQSGAGGALAPPQPQSPSIGPGSSHNVHTSSLVVRLEQELATAVEALVRERQSTAARESSLSERIAALEADLAARDQVHERGVTSRIAESEQNAKEWASQLERANIRLQQVQAENETGERELLASRAEAKRAQTRLASVEEDLREVQGTVDSLRGEVDKLTRKGKDLELGLAQAEHDKKATLAEFESKARQGAARIERQSADWHSRLESQKIELQSEKERDLFQARAEALEIERKWREVEHDAVLLASELSKVKESLAARESEVDKLRQEVAINRSAHDAALRHEREQLETQARTSLARLQSSIDEGQGMLAETSAKLESELRRGKGVDKRLVDLEGALEQRNKDFAELQANFTAANRTATSATALVADHEHSLQSQAKLVANLRATQVQLQDEVQALTLKLDSRANGRNEEQRKQDQENKKYREKSRARIEELESALEEQQRANKMLEQRCDAMKNDFDVALTSATSEQAEALRTLQRKIEKQATKLSTRSETASITAGEKDRLIASLKTDLERRTNAEREAQQQLSEAESRAKKERSRAAELESKLNHHISSAPDGVAHQRVLAELVAAKQVAANIQGRYREMQAKFERQSVRQNALQALLTRLQEEQQQHTFRAPAKSYLATPGLPLYRPLHNYAAPPAILPLDDTLDLDRTTEPGSRSARDTADFSREEEEMYRVLLRDQERARKVKQHVRAYAREGDLTSDDDFRAPAAGRTSFLSRSRSRDTPRARSSERARSHERSDRDWARSSPARSRDDTDINLNLRVNFDPRMVYPTCSHNGAKPHDSRACKVCQRRAFGRGLDANGHFEPSTHIPSRISPMKSRMAGLPHM